MLVGATSGVLVHEAGHYMACRYFGYESGGITFTLHESSHKCEYGSMVTDTEELIMRAAGGGTAVAVFGAALAVFVTASARRAIWSGGHIRFILLVAVTTQIANLILEAAFNQWYNESTRMWWFAVGLAVAIGIEWHLRPGGLRSAT